MSTSSRTPDDKMHRYLQRIQKLVGNRGKSPVMVKSRTKSPLSVKTPQLNNLLKYQIFFKTITQTIEMNRKRHKQDFIDRLKLQKQILQPKYQLLTPIQQKRYSNPKPNDKIISSQSIHQCIDIQIIKMLSQSFQIIKQYVPQQTRNNLFVNKNHRRTYSEIYAETINNTRSKSPSTIYNYEYRTPQVIKKQTIYEFKSKQTRILVNDLGKIASKKLFNTFSQIKSHNGRLLMLQLQQTQQNNELIKQKFNQATKQLSSLTKKNNLTQKELKQSKEKLKLAIQQIKQLKNELMTINQGQDDASKESQSLKKLFQTTKKQLETSKRQAQMLKDTNTKNSKQLLTIKRQLDTKQRQNQVIKNQLTIKFQELESLNQQLKLTKQKYQTKFRQIQKATKSTDSISKQLQLQRKQLQTALKNQEKLKKQLQKKLKSVQNQLSKAKNQINQMQQTIKQNHSYIRQQQQQLQIHKKQTETKQKEIQTTKKQKLSIQKQLQTLKKQTLNKENQIQEIIKQIQNKEKQLQQKQKQLQLRQKKLNQRQKQLLNQQKSLESSKKQLETLKKISLQKDSKIIQNQSIVNIQLDSRSSQLSSLKKQLLLSKQQHNQLKNQLLQSQRRLNQQKEKVFLLSDKQQQKQKQKQINDQQKKQQLLSLQRKVAALKIHQLLSTKFASRKSKFFQAYSELPIIRNSYHSKCLLMEKVVNNLLKDRKQSFMNILSVSPLKSSQQKQPQILERSLTSQIRMKSLYSSKNSLSNASILSSNFDIFAKKINKAFELKTALHEIYSYAFQKIDFTALLYLGIANPLNKQIHKNMTEAFRKVLYFSITKNQQSANDLSFYKSQLLQKGQKILHLLKKIDNKIIFTKIEAYSLLKLNNDLRKSAKIQNQSVISEKELKRELKDFLQQRNKMYEKTFQSWQRTKQMIEDYKLASSQRAY